MFSDVLENRKDFYGAEYIDLAMMNLHGISQGCSWLLFTNEQISNWNINCESRLYGLDKYQLADGLLVDFLTMWEAKLLGEVDPFITYDFVCKAERRCKFAKQRLIEHLSKGDPKVFLGFHITSTSSYRVTVEGKQYPSYPISGSSLCSAMCETGYNFLINGQVVPPLSIINYARACYRGLHLAPSGDAILVTLVKE